MTEQQIMVALTDVKQEHILAGLYTQKRKWKAGWIRNAAVAAVLLLLISVAAIWQGVNHKPTDKAAHFFAITAQAADGSKTNYELNKSYFNSGTFFETNIFGGDMPLFEFALDTTNWTDDPLTMRQYYSNFDVTVSYDGQTEDDADQHIAIFHLMDAEILTGSATTGYGITGWFEEPTDLEICVTEKQTGALVEKTVLHIRYLPEKSGYELTVTGCETIKAYQDQNT